MKTSMLFLMLCLLCVSLFIESFLVSHLGLTLFVVSVLATLVYAKYDFSKEFSRLKFSAERRILDQLAYQEKPVSIALDVENRGPTFKLTIEDILPEDTELAAGSNMLTAIVKRGETAQLRYSIRPMKRGMMVFETIKITAFGKSGLFYGEKIVPLRNELVVHLKEESLRRGLALAKREKLEVTHLSKQRWLRMRDYEFQGIRDYVPGDRFRDIHWRSLAKLDKLLTKIYEKEAMIPTTVLLDCSRSMRLTSGEHAKIDHGVHLSLEISKILLSGYHPTGIVLFDELGVIDKLPPSLRKGQFDHILKLVRSAPPHVTVEKTVEQKIREVASAQSDEKATGGSVSPEEGSEAFLSTIAAFSSPKGHRQTRVGLEGVMRTGIAKGRRKGQLYILISDIGASRDSIIKGTSLAVANEHQMVLATPFGFWYEEEEMSAERLEEMYDSFGAKLEIEKGLQRLGILTVDIGPRDEAVKVTRAIRRKLS